MTKQEEGILRSKFTRWPPSSIWAFQVSGPPQLLRVPRTIVYTCRDHVLESLILDSKYSNMTPKFVKQKSCWLHSLIKFATLGVYFNVCLFGKDLHVFWRLKVMLAWIVHSWLHSCYNFFFCWTTLCCKYDENNISRISRLDYLNYWPHSCWVCRTEVPLWCANFTHLS